MGEEGPCRCARLVSPYSSIPNPKYRLLQMGDESPASPESMTDHQHVGYGAETESSQNFLSAMCPARCQLLHFHLTPLNPQNNLAGQVGLSLFSYRWRNRGRPERINKLPTIKLPVQGSQTTNMYITDFRGIIRWLYSWEA